MFLLLLHAFTLSTDHIHYKHNKMDWFLYSTSLLSTCSKGFISHASFTHSYKHLLLCLSSFTLTFTHIHTSNLGLVSRPRIFEYLVRYLDQTTNLPIGRWPALPPQLQPPQQEHSESNSPKGCDFDLAAIGIYHHAKFECDILKTIDTRLQTNKQTEPITYFFPSYSLPSSAPMIKLL